MSDRSIKDVMDQALAVGEPPIRPDLLGDVVRAARRTKRRQGAAVIAAVAVLAPAVIFGLPALTRALGALPPGHGVVTPGHHDRQSNRAYLWAGAVGGNVARPSFVRPQLPSAVRQASPEPITRQSLGQLLIDVMPRGATLSQVMASLDGVGASRTAVTGFNSVFTEAGAGLVRAELYQSAGPDHNFGCRHTPTVSCASYGLAGGIEVSEYTNIRYEGAGYLLVRVSVFRPAVGIFWIEETNYTFGGKFNTVYPPLSMIQMVSAALDPRWRWTVSQFFAQKASGLKVGQVRPRF